MRAWRIEAKVKDEVKSREPPSAPPPLRQLPWDVAKDEFGTKGAEFIGCLGRILLRITKDQNKTYPTDYPPESRQDLGGAANAKRRAVTYHGP